MKPGLKEPSSLTMRAIWDAYRSELDHVEVLIQKNVNSRVPLLNQIAQYILNSGGKRIRPLLTIIAAKLFGYTGEQHIVVAALVEYIHTATLLHDDVIDQGNVRRGRKSVWALWGNQASILAGDYFYVSAATNSLDLNNQEINQALLGSCSRMIEGEMFQNVYHSDLHMTDDIYLDIIENKTASLISAACRLGAIVSGVPESGKETLAQFGRNLGMAFQLSDDTLDYVAEKDLLGKSLGNDLQEGKITLPLLHLLRSCTEEEKREIQQIVEGNGAMKKEFGYILTLMHRYGSVHHAMGVARRYVNQAKSCLAGLKDSPHKRALQTVADYVVTRDH